MPEFILRQSLTFLLYGEPLCDKKRSKGVGHDLLSIPGLSLLTGITDNSWFL